MNRPTAVIAALAILWIAVASLAAEERRPYKHPDLDFQFSAAPGWRHQPRPGDRETYEMVDPATGIHVLMWHTTTEQSAAGYLDKMAHMMDLDLSADGSAERQKIDDRVVWQGCSHRLYPETHESPPNLPSPFAAAAGETYVTVRTRDGRYALVPVTVENGAPNLYENGEWGKGRQLLVDDVDFPTLARTGLHSETELDGTTTITGLSVAEITVEARPGHASRTGFVAEDEDILSVIRGDNQLVARLGLTHPQLACPLFNVFNMILRDLELYRRGQVPAHNIATLLWNGREIHIEASGGKGWQEPLFADEVHGYWSIDLRRDPEYQEEQFVERQYRHLTAAQRAALLERLTTIHTGEMVPFMIMRYGFYEGHTDYRADPLAIASLFGLLSLEEIHAAAQHDLVAALDRHYTTKIGTRH